MDYFIMQTDPKLNNVVKLSNWQESLNDDPITNYLAVVPIKTRCIFVEDGPAHEYPDYFEKPLTLIAEKFKDVINAYQNGIEFQPIVLTEEKTHKQTVYYLMSAPMIDCASSESKLDHIGKIKELVLDTEKVGHYKIFYAAGFVNRLIVRLDVAESILRRDSYGITFEKLIREDNNNG